MKKLFKLSAFVFLFGFLFVSCDESRDDVETPKTIYELASMDADLSNLKAAIDKAGLASTLGASGSFTVFAPSNAAFTQFLADNGFANLNDVPNATLK
uniref:fasciclin domain-containing protein n=1 Tax=Kaistella sp. TaxID=2782235 RepID=UPI002F92F21F